MRSRFASNLLVLLVGAFLAPTRFVFGAGGERWLAFAAGGAVVAVTVVGFAARGRGPLQRGIDVTLVIVGAWAVVSALSESAGTVGWLALAEGGAAVILAGAGLVGHEVVMERAVRARPAAERVVAAGGRGHGGGEPTEALQQRRPVPVSSRPA